MKQPWVYMCSPSRSPLPPPTPPTPPRFSSAPGPSACLMHPTWAGDLLHPRYHTCFDAQSLSRVWLFGTPWTAARQASLSITNSWRPPKPMSIELVMPCNHLILCCPLLLLPSIFPSIRVFKWVSTSYHIAKVLEFQLQYQSFQWTPGVIFRIDWLHLLAVQETLKNLLQHQSSTASILWRSASFIVQLSHSFITNGKT